MCCSVAVLQFKIRLFKGQDLYLYLYILYIIYINIEVISGFGKPSRELQHCNTATHSKVMDYQKECLGRLVRTSSTVRSDALHESKECFLTPLRKHRNGGCEALERAMQSIGSEK